MSADLPYRVFTLPDPFRVVVDLPEVAWSLPDARQPQARGHFSALSFGLFASGTSRVVLAVTGPVLLQKVFVIPPAPGTPHRLVVDKIGKASCSEIMRQYVSHPAFADP